VESRSAVFTVWSPTEGLLAGWDGQPAVRSAVSPGSFSRAGGRGGGREGGEKGDGSRGAVVKLGGFSDPRESQPSRGET
jgi:hypothetical protein